MKSGKRYRAGSKAFMILCLSVLNKEFGFGGKRVERFVDAFGDLLQEFNRGNVNLDKLNEEVFMKTGVRVL